MFPTANPCILILTMYINICRDIQRVTKKDIANMAANVGVIEDEENGYGRSKVQPLASTPKQVLKFLIIQCFFMVKFLLTEDKSFVFFSYHFAGRD